MKILISLFLPYCLSPSVFNISLMVLLPLQWKKGQRLLQLKHPKVTRKMHKLDKGCLRLNAPIAMGLTRWVKQVWHRRLFI